MEDKPTYFSVKSGRGYESTIAIACLLYKIVYGDVISTHINSE